MKRSSRSHYLGAWRVVLLVDGREEEVHESVEAAQASTNSCAVAIGRRMQGGEGGPPFVWRRPGRKGSKHLAVFQAGRGTCWANPWRQIQANLPKPPLVALQPTDN
jgi:hypothetical protein